MNNGGIVLSLLFFSLLPITLLAERPSFELGFECTSYGYRESTETINSSATPRSTRLTAKLSCHKTIPWVFSAAVPLSQSRGGERWLQNPGILFQRNDLEEEYLSLAFHLHPFKRERRVFVGFRWDDLRQVRDNFSNAAGLVAYEDVESKWFEAGFRLALGKDNKGRRPWDKGGQISLVLGLAFDVHLTNTALPGFVVDDSDGWLWRMDLQFPSLGKTKVYPYFTYEKIHWDGSAWIPYGATQARWPTNDTRAITFGLRCPF